MIGCASESLKLSSYTRVKDVTKAQLSTKLQDVKVRVRSYEDPAIQALLLTEGTFVIGMDPKFKMALSVCGVIFSLACFACIAKQCVLTYQQDRERYRREKRARLYQQSR